MDDTTHETWATPVTWLRSLSHNLDPSLFQNIILVILAIFIPFAIVFLSDVLDSTKERSDFEKLVLSEEVLGTKKVFLVAVFGIGVLAFFSGKDIALLHKLIAVSIALYCIVTLSRFFTKTLRYSEGYKSEFELAFLKKLNLGNRWRPASSLKIDRINRAWSALWLGPTVEEERKFTEMFVRHVDNALKRKNYRLAIQLAHTYDDNIKHREVSTVGQTVLPATLKWNEALTRRKQAWLNTRKRRIGFEKSVTRSLPNPGFAKFAKKLIRAICREDTTFWEWDYFERVMFPEVVATLIRHGHGRYQFFELFREYIDELEKICAQAEDEEKEVEAWGRMQTLMRHFSRTFFGNLDDYSEALDIWENHFPSEWKVASVNTDNIVSRIMVNEFIIWASSRIFRTSDEEEDSNLTAVVGGLFPNQHGALFSVFLAMFFSEDIPRAIKKIPNFTIHDSFVYSRNTGDLEDFDRIYRERSESQKIETVSVILAYFGHHWSVTKITEKDLSSDEYQNWKGYTTEQRKKIVNRVRQDKFKDLLHTLESAEIRDVCGGLKNGDERRERFLVLVELLLARVSEE